MGKRKKAKKKADRQRAAGEVAAPDAVDAIIAAWQRERPDLDVASVGVVLRVNRLSARFTQALEGTFAHHGLTKANFEALAALARGGEPYSLSQARLMQDLSLTPGTVSARVSRLVADGFVERTPDPENRRGVIVSLTNEGRAAFESVVDAQFATERNLLAVLTAGEREMLAGLLRLLLESAQSPAHRVQ